MLLNVFADAVGRVEAVWYVQRGLVLATLARLQTESVHHEATVAGASIPHTTTFETDPKGMREMRAHRYAALYDALTSET
jgi:hypothetical protein